MKLSLFKKEIVLVKTIIQDGITFQVFLDDYGQSYLLVWEDPITHKEESWCCGTYNDYQNDFPTQRISTIGLEEESRNQKNENKKKQNKFIQFIKK